MSKVKVKKIKIPASMNNEGLAEMFNQMLGTGPVNITIAYPRYMRIKILCEQIVKIFELLAASPFMRAYPEFSIQKEQIVDFCKTRRAQITELFCVDYAAYEWNLILLDDESQKKFATVYENVKKSDIVNNFIIMCDKLVRYKKNFIDINTLNHKFITSMPGAEWYPFPFTTLNLKYIFSLPLGENTITFFMTILNKAYEFSRNLYDEVQSPDIDMDQFVEIMMSNIDEIQKRPELSRCRKAFDKIKQSVCLLKTNFNTYYRDFIGTKDSTIIMQHFIIDVSKSTNADAQVTQQFKKIVSYYQKIAREQITNPKVKLLFDTVNESFKQLERGTENLVNIRDEEVDTDSNNLDVDDSDPIEFLSQALSAADINTDLTDSDIEST